MVGWQWAAAGAVGGVAVGAGVMAIGGRRNGRSQTEPWVLRNSLVVLVVGVAGAIAAFVLTYRATDGARGGGGHDEGRRAVGDLGGPRCRPHHRGRTGRGCPRRRPRSTALILATAHGAVDLALAGHLSRTGKGRADPHDLVDDVLDHLRPDGP
jgi:hypothetical protein